MNPGKIIRLLFIAIILVSCSGKVTSLPPTEPPATAAWTATSTNTPSPLESMAADLLAYFPFNGNAEDASGNGHHSEANQVKLIPDRFGNQDSAYRFDGLKSSIKIPASSNLNLTSDFSIGLWLNISNGLRSNDVMLINKHKASQNKDGSWWLALEKPGKLLRFGATGKDDFEFVKASQEISLNQWHCVFYTYSQSTYTWKFYLDGQSAGSSSMEFNIQQPNLDLYFGAEETQGGELQNYFAGDLDDVMIFKRSLSPAEIDSLCSGKSIALAAMPTTEKTEPVQPSRTDAANSTQAPTLKPTSTWNFGNLGPIASIRSGSDNEITLLNPDGSTKQILFSDHGSSTDIEFHLSWSPDGQYIAFNKTNYDDIYILSVSDKTAVNITQTEDAFEFNATWSPNGEWIAFTYLAKRKNTQEIGVIRPDGTGKNILVECEVFCTSPSWSPDGQYITFSKKEQIYVMRADGSELKALTHNAVNQAPAWSPDGKFIAFIRSLSVYENGYLYLMNADGSSLRALTGEKSSLWNYVSWSPDSKYIVMQYAPEGGGQGLYIINVQTGEIKGLTGSNFYGPAWYPILGPVNQETSEETPVAREDCTNGWTRLTAGGQAKVMGAPTDPPNRVRSEPVIADNVIGEIYPDSILKVLEGPVCASGLVFWKVQSTAIPGGVGWTAEGDGTEFYLEPYAP